MSGGGKGKGAGAGQGARSRAQLAAMVRRRGGGGMKGGGRGTGGVAPEDPSAASSFVPQRSRAMITAGKTLLQIEGQLNAPEPVPVATERAAAIEAVKQGAAEAMLRENVPAEYHDAIKKYFDDLGRGKK